MSVVARVRPLADKLPTITYRWDPDTDILSGVLQDATGDKGLTGTVDLEGVRGGFVVIDVEDGAIRGLDVVDWPEDTVTVGTLVGPEPARDADVTFPARPSQPGVAAVELEAPLKVEKSSDESVIHIRLLGRGTPHAVRVADKLLLELDPEDRLVGLWLLDVPPFRALDAC